MSPPIGDSSDTDSDDEFKEDMAALKRPFQITGLDPSSVVSNRAASVSSPPEVDSDEDDLRFLRSFQERFAVEEGPLDMKPLRTLPPADCSETDDCDDDYIRDIKRRFFACYDDTGDLKDNTEDSLHSPLQVGATTIDSEKETSISFVERTNPREKFLNCVDTNEPTDQIPEVCDDAGKRQLSDLVEGDGPGADDVAGLPLKTSQFPKPALALLNAINKNRTCQKLIRHKMMQMEARMEELKKLTERVKILKDFQVACRKRTGRALSQKKDARLQLISVPRLRAISKLNEKKIHAVYKGPPENSCVAKCKEVLATFPISVSREKWSKQDKENLVKGVKQQFQDMLLQQSIIDADGSSESINVDSVIASIEDVDITPETMRLFLPKVNWEQLAATYLPSRSGAECQARFLNWEDPLINHNPSWTPNEDKILLHTIQEKGLSNWIDIAASLRTNRTPFQCLARYQRSLNASILKREWTKEEDNQLRDAVKSFGESNWQLVASVLEGRTGTQCSNRWMKTLHPTRERSGKWTAEEDKRMKVAVTLFGPRTWKKVASYVPGRTQVQCRERWVNCLDPSLNRTEWTEEEDSKLEEAIAKHGYCWSKVAACIPCRTDNQCWRRWKALFPDEVPQAQAARKIRKAALISNFVDRESQRPALGPKDFRLPDESLYRITGGSENVSSTNRKTKTRRPSSRRRKKTRQFEEDDLSSCSDICSDDEVSGLITNETSEVENVQCRRKGMRKRSRPLKLRDESSDSEEIKKRPRLPQKKRSLGAKSELFASDADSEIFPDSMLLKEAVNGIKAMRKKERRSTPDICLSSELID